MKLDDIQVIIWDVDGTLYETHDLSHEVYVSAYKAIEEVMHWPEAKCIEEFEKVHEKITLSATEAVAMICNLTTAQSAVLTDKYLDRMRFISHDDKLIALFGELNGFSHYILGNGSKDRIIEGLRGLGLDPAIFKEIVTSELVGVNKPKDDGFRYIAEKSGLPYANHLMVGDRDRVDLIPAKALGMKTALVWSIKPSTVADITLPTVYELSQVLL